MREIQAQVVQQQPQQQKQGNGLWSYLSKILGLSSMFIPGMQGAAPYLMGGNILGGILGTNNPLNPFGGGGHNKQTSPVQYQDYMQSPFGMPSYPMSESFYDMDQYIDPYMFS